MAQKKEVELEKKENERSNEKPRLMTIDISLLEKKDHQILSLKNEYESCQNQVLEEKKKRQNIILYFKSRISLLNIRIDKLKAINRSLLEKKEIQVVFFKNKYELCRKKIHEETMKRQNVILNFNNRISVLNNQIEKLKAINSRLLGKKISSNGSAQSSWLPPEELTGD